MGHPGPACLGLAGQMDTQLLQGQVGHLEGCSWQALEGMELQLGRAGCRSLAHMGRLDRLWVPLGTV